MTNLVQLWLSQKVIIIETIVVIVTTERLAMIKLKKKSRKVRKWKELRIKIRAIIKM